MITLATALKLQKAGLKWAPALHDFFAIPHRGLDDYTFVVSDMTINVELWGNHPVITFDGASEWAMDYVTTADVVWLPTEDQLRRAINSRIFGYPDAEVKLIEKPSLISCELGYAGKLIRFEAGSAGDAYAKVLLELLRHEKQNHDGD